MDVGGFWTGTIRGTNFGELIVQLVQSGEAVTGVARLNDFQFGSALYSVIGTATNALSLKLLPEKHEPGLNYDEVEVSARINRDSNTISGQWGSPGPGTHGFFDLQRHSLSSTENARERRVFVVHGHDQTARKDVVAHLQTLGLSPILLDEQPSEGMTIIEKLEKHADVDFAVVLLTDDDEGRKSASGAALRPRARQNVVLELGYFVGKLGRSGVCALYAADVEMPSDYHGVVYIPLAEPTLWRRNLTLELQQRWPDLAT